MEQQQGTPPEARKWNWGAFLLGPIWGIGNKVWIALLALIPFIGWIMNIILGIKGSEWAWEAKEWRDLEHFRRTQRKWGFWGLGVFAVSFAFFFLIGIMGAMISDDPVVADNKTQAVEKVANDKEDIKEEKKEESKKVEPKEEEEPTWSDGTYIVGEDIEPGIYKSDGSAGYYARLKDLSGGLDAIIANGNASGPVYVEIKESDEAFQTNRMTWKKIDLDKYKGEPQEHYSDGIYLVGKDIDPGTYKVDGGYWARLKNISGEMGAVIANENVSGTGYVTIAESDYAIEIKRGTLTKK